MPIKRSLLRKKRRKESWLNYIMSVSHLWLGLLSSLVVFTVCLSGSIYAFKQPIENLVYHHAVYINPGSTSQVSLDTLLGDFESRYGLATTVKIHQQPGRSIIISSLSKNNPGTTAYYDPYTGKLLAIQSKYCTAFFDFILEIHRFLLAGEVGKFINGMAILIFAFLLVSGLVLWTPKKLNQLKRSLTIRWKARFYRLNYDLHSVLGFYTMMLLLLMAVTGLYVSFHWMKNLLIVGLGGDSIVISENNLALRKNLSESFRSTLLQLAEQQHATATNWAIQSLVNQSHHYLENHGPMIIRLPTEQSNYVRVIKMSRDNLLHWYVPNVIDFSLKGQIRKISCFRDLALHEQFKAIARPLHTGEIWGITGIIIYFVTSLIGCSLPVTGFIIWWKRGAKNYRSNRHDKSKHHKTKCPG